MSYLRLGAMIVTSTVVMFGLMYLNTYSVEHVRFSETRAYMALLMGATMALIMLLFMWAMYNDRHIKMTIIAGSLVVFAGSLWLVRSQAMVDDVSYMRAMIPHHSIAVMTSSRAHIRDQRVRRLADGILRAQMREIDQMNRLIADLERHPPRSDAPDLPAIRPSSRLGRRDTPFSAWTHFRKDDGLMAMANGPGAGMIGRRQTLSNHD